MGESPSPKYHAYHCQVDVVKHDIKHDIKHDTKHDNKDATSSPSDNDSTGSVHTIDIDGDDTDQNIQIDFKKIGIPDRSSDSFDDNKDLSINFAAHYNLFDDEIHRRRFINKTILCTIFQILVAVVTCVIVNCVDPINTYLSHNLFNSPYPWYGFNCLGSSIFMMMIWFKQLTRSSPLRYIVFISMNLINLYVLTATVFYLIDDDSSEIHHKIMYIGIVIIITAILSLFLLYVGLNAINQFNKYEHMMKICMSILVIYGLVMIFICAPVPEFNSKIGIYSDPDVCRILHLIYGIFGLILMCGFIIMHTQDVCSDIDEIYIDDDPGLKYRYDEYLSAGLNSYIGILYLFLFIMGIK